MAGIEEILRRCIQPYTKFGPDLILSIHANHGLFYVKSESPIILLVIQVLATIDFLKILIVKNQIV